MYVHIYMYLTTGRRLRVSSFYRVSLSLCLSAVLKHLYIVNKIYRVHICFAYSTNETLSTDTKFKDLTTLTLDL